MYTIEFTEKHGFFGVYLLASWPNAAFDMCGMTLTLTLTRCAHARHVEP